MNANPNQKRKRRNDLMLIVLLLLIGGIAAALSLNNRHSGAQVIVRVDGEIHHMFPLDENRTMTIDGINGGHNDLMIQDGVVWLEEATCPDKLCVLQGKIQYSGDAIICLPNAVVVEIAGEGADALEMDAVSK